VKFRQVYYIFSGIVLHFFFALCVILFAKYFDLTVPQFAYRLSEKLSIDNKYLEDYLLNSTFVIDNIQEYSLPKLSAQSPRLVPQISKLTQGKIDRSDFNQDLLKKYNPCKIERMLWLTSCAILTKNTGKLKSVKEHVNNFVLTLPNASGHHGTGWQLGFVYDSLKTQIEFSTENRARINKKLEKAVKHYLVLLNSSSPSLWHGRATLTAQMWITLMALDSVSDDLLAATAPHFYSMIEALSITEAWPEGYNYWVNSRAIYIVLAISGYLNGMEEDYWHPKLNRLLVRIGKWHIYATRPDLTIEPLGDEGPRIDRKDETSRVIDLIGQLTEKKIFYGLSDSIAKQHGRANYFSDYRWGWPLFKDVNSQYLLNESSETNYRAELPFMDIFGKNYFGQAYIHQNWEDKETFISYRSGDSFTHHGHYDNGHISLFKSAPLLVNSSMYGKYSGDNRLNYAIRSVAKNTILIQKNNELNSISTSRRANVSDGGQRITMPLGSAILSVDDWFKKRTQGKVLTGGRIIGSYSNGSISYINSDLTKAYNSSWYDENDENGKVSQVKRQILYLHKQDVLIVFDDIKTTDQQYQAKILYHTVNKPQVPNAVVVKGVKNNGISKSQSRIIKTKNLNAHLVTEIIGKMSDVSILGGKDYKFYVESDGDEAQFNGTNFNKGLGIRKSKKAPSWRFEINLPTDSTHHQLYSIHRPSIDEFSKSRTIEHKLPRGRVAIQIDNVGVIFENSASVLPKIEGINVWYQCGALPKVCNKYLLEKGNVQEVSSEKADK